MSGNILIQAAEITTKDRQKAYGPPAECCQRAADIATVILGKEIKATDIPKIMLALKLARHEYKPKEDNLVDMAGYVWVLGEVEKEVTDA